MRSNHYWQAVVGVAWPESRFTDNDDGTVTDNLTGLIWLKNAACGGYMTWAEALVFANSLHDGWAGDGSENDCGLSDDSNAGDWRLPNVRELQSLVHYGFYDPAVPDTAGTGNCTEGPGCPFTNLGTGSYYWSSTTHADGTDGAWLVGMNSGYVLNVHKGLNFHVWPVRGGN